MLNFWKKKESKNQSYKVEEGFGKKDLEEIFIYKKAEINNNKNKLRKSTKDLEEIKNQLFCLRSNPGENYEKAERVNEFKERLEGQIHRHQMQIDILKDINNFDELMDQILQKIVEQKNRLNIQEQGNETRDDSFLLDFFPGLTNMGFMSLRSLIGGNQEDYKQTNTYLLPIFQEVIIMYEIYLDIIDIARDGEENYNTNSNLNRIFETYEKCLQNKDKNLRPIISKCFQNIINEITFFKNNSIS